MVSTLALWFLLAGYALIIALFVIQRRLRRTQSAKSFRTGSYEKGSTALIGSAVGVGLLLPLALDGLGVGTFPIDLLEGSVAFSVMLAGLGLRIWAALTLGKFYTTTLRITEGQKVVTSGPYARVRHPGYLAEVVLWSGFGVVSGNLIVASVVPVMILAVFLYRISVEEKMLVQALGDDYIQYQRRTRRRVPFF